MSHRKFKTEDDLTNKFDEYLEKCKDGKLFPNIAGFCVHCGMHTEILYNQQTIYPVAYKKIQSALENAVLTDKTTTPAERIFYLKNKFGYADKQEVNQTITVEELTDDQRAQKIKQLQKRLSSNVTEGDFRHAK